MDKVKSKRKGTNQQKKTKVVATNKEPNVQSTDQRDPKQNVVAAMNFLGQAFFSRSVFDCISISAEQKCCS